MYVLLSLDELIKLKEVNNGLQLFRDSLNHELELKKHEIGIVKKFKGEDAVKNLRYEYSGMVFVKDIFNTTMGD